MRLVLKVLVITWRDYSKDLICVVQVIIALLVVRSVFQEEWVVLICYDSLLFKTIINLILFRIKTKDLISVLMILRCLFLQFFQLVWVKVLTQEFRISPDEIDVWRMLRLPVVQQLYGSISC